MTSARAPAFFPTPPSLPSSPFVLQPLPRACAQSFRPLVPELPRRKACPRSSTTLMSSSSPDGITPAPPPAASPSPSPSPAPGAPEEAIGLPPPAPSSLRARYGPWAVVTGASSGIGAEFARQLAAAGLHVVLVARRADRLHELAGALERAASVSTVVVAADLSTGAGRAAVLDATAELDVGLLVSNAGVEFHGLFAHADDASIERLVAVNVTAVAVLARAFGGRFAARARSRSDAQRAAGRMGGGVLFVSSVSSHGFPFLSAYAASKAFVSTLALSAGAELHHLDVSSMALEPGLVKTEMTVRGEGDKTADDGYHEQDSWWLMPVDQCVREALALFGSRAEYTPGLVNRVVRSLLLCLPRPWAMGLMARFMLSQAPNLLES